MVTETKTESDADTTTSEGEGKEQEVETVSVPKKDYDTMNQTLGSLKRELKDLRKAKEEAKETSKTNQPEENVLLQKFERMSLRAAGITHQDDIELAKTTAKKWGMDLDEVVLDDDFKIKLGRQQTTRANTLASSEIRGGQGGSQAKNTPEYWIAKGVPPTPADVSDRKTRATIIKAMMKNAGTSGKKFYND